MLPTNSQLRKQTREALYCKWGLSAMITLLYIVFIYGISFIVAMQQLFVIPFVLSLFLSLFSIGYMFIFYDVFKTKQEPKFITILEPFRHFVRYFLVTILLNVFILFWTLLLIVPGIIKGFAYSMTYYIMRDNPEMPAFEAIKTSQKMMKGNKKRFFVLMLSFAGWALLSIVTCGIGLLWLYPYITTATVAFYESLKEQQGNVSEETIMA